MKTILSTEIFDNWFENLRDNYAKRRIQVRIDCAENGNFGDFKAVGEGVLEMRIDTGAGYRVYFIQRGIGQEIVILLAGGDKSTQNNDIKTAQQLAKQLKETL
jgi:putative addiction module killer protein